MKYALTWLEEYSTIKQKDIMVRRIFNNKTKRHYSKTIKSITNKFFKKKKCK